MAIRNADNQRGAILVTVIMLMAIVALLGTLAINSATVDMQISGFMRRVATAFSGAEAGTDLAVPLIETTIAAGELTIEDIENVLLIDAAGDPGNGLAALVEEITGGSDYDPDTASASPDLTLTDLNGVEVRVDIDRMYAYTLPGGAMEFAAGYEGVGAAAAGGGIGILYRITSEGTR
jgi:hypothetical protein